ncbi:hypothetical protein TNCV_1419101 [Trichonephila clavipes]|nr:hypothetical protein TNCV_1419101 [Trichonephila clavipes]
MQRSPISPESEEYTELEGIVWLLFLLHFEEAFRGWKFPSTCGRKRHRLLPIPFCPVAVVDSNRFSITLMFSISAELLT